MKVAVTLEALNESAVLADVLGRVPAGLDVFLVDDGSTDDTAEVAVRCGARVIRHPGNLGQGLAFVTGIRAVLLHDYDGVVHLDSDGQHNPEDIPKFIQTLQNTDFDVVVGSRILGSQGRTTFLRGLCLPLLTRMVNKATGYRLTDAMCGFRAYRCDALRRAMHIFERYHHPQYNAVEMFIRFGREGLSVCEIPIHVETRRHGASYKGELRYGWNVMVAMLKAVLE